jgi:hypothetical protein
MLKSADCSGMNVSSLMYVMTFREVSQLGWLSYIAEAMTNQTTEQPVLQIFREIQFPSMRDCFFFAHEIIKANFEISQLKISLLELESESSVGQWVKGQKWLCPLNTVGTLSFPPVERTSEIVRNHHF